MRKRPAIKRPPSTGKVKGRQNVTNEKRVGKSKDLPAVRQALRPEVFHLVRHRGRGITVQGEATLQQIINTIRESRYSAKDKARRVPGFLLNRFTPQGGQVQNKMAYIERVTGWWTFDFDVKDLEKATAIRDSIIKAPEVVASWLSISGKSAKALAWFPPPPVDIKALRNFAENERREKRRIEVRYYGALCDRVRSFLGENSGVEFDMSVGMLHQPVWLSSDADLRLKKRLPSPATLLRYSFQFHKRKHNEKSK